ncbi:MAG: hypothetical protein ABSA64_10510 [Sedimentisphaerales bacterium]|jgi:rRNA maturation endonuclease Nob1
MSKYHCVLDTSTLLKKYHKENGSSLVERLFNCQDCALHILNISIPEVTGAFLKFQLAGEIKQADRYFLLKLFIDDIKEYRVVIHNITHRNVEFTDDVWDYSLVAKPPKESVIKYKVECPLCKKEYEEEKKVVRKWVGPIDVLILSVCKELLRAYKNAILFTSDGHMQSIANKMGIKVCNPETATQLPF